MTDECCARIAIEGEVDAQVAMSTALFRRAFSNLLQNAIEHSADGARLVVRIEPAADAVWVFVANPGAAIAPDALPRLFKRSTAPTPLATTAATTGATDRP